MKVVSEVLPPDEYKENKDRYDKEIARIQQQMNRLEEADNNFYLTATYLLQLFEHGDKLFEVANIEEKRELLQLVLSNLKLARTYHGSIKNLCKFYRKLCLA